MWWLTSSDKRDNGTNKFGRKSFKRSEFKSMMTMPSAPPCPSSCRSSALSSTTDCQRASKALENASNDASQLPNTSPPQHSPALDQLGLQLAKPLMMRANRVRWEIHSVQSMETK